MKKNRFLFLILPIITLFLELLPYGAVLNFMIPAEGSVSIGCFRETYSYFSLMPFGYANFAPLFTAVLTCIILVLLVIYCFIGKDRMLRAIKVLLYICALFSLGPLVLGIRYFSVVGALITATLIAEIVFLHIAVKTSEEDR